MDVRGRRWIRSVALAAVLAGGAATASGDSSTAEAPSGARLYAIHECAGCHETAEISGFEVVPLHTLGSRYDEAALAALLDAPPQSMPRFPLSEAERHALARYLRKRFP